MRVPCLGGLDAGQLLEWQALLGDTPLNAEQRELVAIIRQSGDSLLGVINNILHYAELVAHPTPRPAETHDLPACLEEILDTHAAAAAAKHLALIYTPGPGLPRLVATDRERLQEILHRLLDNAIKFTLHGEVVVRVEVASLAPGRRHLRVSIGDTGPGIPAAGLDRLFRPFSQVDSSPSRAHGGTGLGLAICQQLAELMDGQLTVESRVGQGSTFHLTVPLTVIREEPPIGQPPGPTLRPGRRLLLVEANATQRRLLEALLQSWHLRPTGCANAAEARQHLATGQPFDLALLDAGTLAPDEMAELLPRAAPHVLLLLAPDQSAPTGTAAPFATLTKPLKPTALFAALRQIPIEP